VQSRADGPGCIVRWWAGGTTQELNAGEHVFTAEIVGSNPAATPRHMLGLAAGENAVSFTCTGPAEYNTRVKVTVITQGPPLSD